MLEILSQPLARDGVEDGVSQLHGGQTGNDAAPLQQHSRRLRILSLTTPLIALDFRGLLSRRSGRHQRRRGPPPTSVALRATSPTLLPRRSTVTRSPFRR